MKAQLQVIVDHPSTDFMFDSLCHKTNIIGPSFLSKTSVSSSRVITNSTSQIYFQKYANILFYVNLQKYQKALNSCLINLDQFCHIKTSIEQWKKILKIRQSIMQSCEDKLIRGSIYRNNQLKLRIQNYANQYKKKFTKEQFVTLSFEKHYAQNKQKTQPKQIIHSYIQYRPRSTYVDRLAKSIAMEKKGKSQQDILMNEQKMEIIQQKIEQIKNQNRQKIGDLSDLRYKINMIEQKRRNFFPITSYRSKRKNNSWTSRTTPINRLNQLNDGQFILDKLKLINCDFSVICRRQHAYRKKIRNPRLISNNLI